MRIKPKRAPAAAELRRLAEERLQEQHPETGPARSEADTQCLLHELQVHQIELEMQNAELAAARNEMETGLEKYSDLYDFAPVGYLTLDREGTIQEANLTSATLLGIERSRLVKRRFGLYVAPAGLPAFTAFLTKVFQSKARESCELTMLRDGQRPVEVRIEAVVAAAGQECRVVLADLTAHIRAEQDRLILNKLESTRVLAGGLSHDFNNLLAVILLNLELAETHLPLGEELARRLGDAKQAALSSRDLIRQIITFTKGSQPLRTLTSLSGVIEDSVRPALSGSRVRCDISPDGDLWLAEVDAAQIAQALRNIVLNAREAMPAGGVVSVRADNVVLGTQDHPSLPPGDYVRVSIADQGGGIPKEVLPKIFDPYFSTKQRGNQKGMGLGLTICHTIIHGHRGAIVVQSEMGVGTTFHLYLPASLKSLQEERKPAAPSLSRQARILVMDDEAALRAVVGSSLQSLGHAVELVEDGQRAVEVYESAKARGCPFDAVILDLTVRGGPGGQEAIQALRKIDPAVKAILMSGYAKDPVVLEPERYGFQAVLAKPFQIVKLREVLARVLGE